MPLLSHRTTVIIITVREENSPPPTSCALHKFRSWLALASYTLKFIEIRKFSSRIYFAISPRRLKVVIIVTRRSPFIRATQRG